MAKRFKKPVTLDLIPFAVRGYLAHREDQLPHSEEDPWFSAWLLSVARKSKKTEEVVAIAAEQSDIPAQSFATPGAIRVAIANTFDMKSHAKSSPKQIVIAASKAAALEEKLDEMVAQFEAIKRGDTHESKQPTTRKNQSEAPSKAAPSEGTSGSGRRGKRPQARAKIPGRERSDARPKSEADDVPRTAKAGSAQASDQGNEIGVAV